MRSAALVLIALGALGAAVAPLAAQTKAPAPAPKSGGSPPAATPKPPATKSEKGPGPRSNAPIVIDADRMEAFKKDGLVVFSGNVIAKQENSVQTADRMEVYLDDKGDRITRTVSTGNVRIITRDCRSGTAKRAEYYDAEQRVVLIGNARVWRDDNVVTGERITIYLAEDRSLVEGGQQERVKAVFYPKSQDQAAARPKPTAGQCS
jgi:lipopolysaccharide export system protein LptA